MSFYYGSSANRKFWNQRVLRGIRETSKTEIVQPTIKQGWFKRLFNKLKSMI